MAQQLLVLLSSISMAPSEQQPKLAVDQLYSSVFSCVCTGIGVLFLKHQSETGMQANHVCSEVYCPQQKSKKYQ